MFQDDNARIHQAEVGRDRFREQETSRSHTDWPPQSPHLDPSENLWDVLEEPLLSGHTQPSSVRKRLQHWMETTAVTLQKLMGTTPQPACGAIKARGRPTHVGVCDLFLKTRQCVCANNLGEQVVPVVAAVVCNLQTSVLLWKL